MRSFFKFLPVSARILLSSSAFWLVACGENSQQADPVDSEAKATATRQEAPPSTEQGAAGEAGLTGDTQPPDGQITELQREIDAGRQNIEDIDAFVQMERAKLEDDPNYDQSFLLEALNEQQEIREAVESGENRLQELTRPDE